MCVYKTEENQNNKTIYVKKINDKAIIPKYATPGSAALDLRACINETVTINPGETVMVPTGLAFAIPVGYVGLLFARSGLATKQGLAPANKVGVIDSDYRGEVMVALHNHGKNTISCANEDRIAQIAIMPVQQCSLMEVDELDSTERGTGGFGSTGSN